MTNERQVPWAIAMVFVVLGFMLSMQFKVQRQVELKDVTQYQRAQELAGQLEKAEDDRDAAMAELEEIRAQLRSDADKGEQLAEQLRLAQLQAGLLPVKGPGVRVILNDSTRPPSAGENPNNYIIHDQDVLMTINELTAEGAEALAVNGQRLTDKSEIQCTGATITINRVRTAPPIEIIAIGDPDALESRLHQRGGIIEQLKVWGIQVEVSKEPEIVVPAYRGSLKWEYATPTE